MTTIEKEREKDPIILLTPQQEKDDFFTKPPAWIVRYGISLLSVIFLTFFLLAYFISYPDVVEQNVLITAMNPPQRIIAQNTGKYIVLAKDQEKVKSGQVLAYTDIDNTSSPKDLSLLENKLAYTFSDTLSLPNLFLGELQGSYESYRLAYLAYQQYFSSAVALQIKSLEEQLHIQKNILQGNLKQQTLSLEEFVLTEKAYQRDQSLYEKKIISGVDFEKSTQSYLSAKKNLQNLEQTILQSYSQINQTSSKIEEIKISNREKEQKTMADLQAAKEKLLSEIESYKKKHFIIALQDGTVNYLNLYPQSNRTIQVVSGQEIMAIIADDKKLVGVLNITSEQTAKVSKNQKVQIRLLNYPYEEYGMLSGKVERISAISNQKDTKTNPSQEKNEKQYRVEITIASMTTDQKQNIPFTGELEGTARIITKNYSVLERIFLSVLKTVKK